MKPIRVRAPAPKSRFKIRYLFKIAVFLIALGFGLRTISHHVTAAVPHINAGIHGYCLDDYQNAYEPNNPIDSWLCNNSPAQEWQIKNLALVHNGWCLTVKNNDIIESSKVVLSSCNSTPGQVWLPSGGALENPNSGLCLTVPSGKTDRQLVIDSCNTSSGAQQWSSSNGTAVQSCMGNNEGEKIACTAALEWNHWHTAGQSHEALLTQYTYGAPYEEWCADFVSYVYKTAGYPFQSGEADGWNENNANNLQYMGLTLHDPSNYIPKAGDIAYFNYDGGHAEIVVSGGPHPTFIYGNSATIDPTTGNGEMAANTLLSDGSVGQLQYYLTPL